jgi:arylsulfatase A-like enzyme
MTSKLPNIVLIVLDTVGAKHLSLYDYQRRTTPNLERIAEKSTVYNRCFAPSSWTMPSHGSIFTGLYPSQHGAFEGRFFLNPNVQHLATALKMQGYRTWGISSNYLVTPESGLFPECDYFMDFGYSRPKNFGKALKGGQAECAGELQARIRQGLNVRQVAGIFLRYVLETRRLREAWQCGKGLVRKGLKKLSQRDSSEKSAPFTEKTTQIFQQLMQRNGADGERPFFLFINLMEAHQRFRPPLKWRQFSHWYDKQYLPMNRCYYQPNSPYKESILQKYCNLYDDEVRYEDDVIGRLWDIACKSPASDRTIWIITSDHGEHCGEKDYYGHGLSLYNELIWIPLLIHYPDGVAAQGANNRLASLVDIYATLLDLTGNPLPRPVSSSSLLDATQRDVALAQIIFPEIFQNQLKGKLQLSQQTDQKFSPHTLAAITASGLKLINSRDGTLKAFNLEKDPREENDLAVSAPAPALADWQALMGTLAEESGYNEAWQDLVADVPQGPDSKSFQEQVEILQNFYCS